MIEHHLLGRALLRLARRIDPVWYARLLGVTVGERCKLISTNFGSEPYLVTLGDHVEITQGVQFVTHDGGVWVLRDRHPDLDVVAPIVVEDNVFVGLGSILLPGIRIGRNSVVAAGSVVTKNVAPGTVVAGVPARPICTIEEYEKRVLAKDTKTKRLAPAEKRRDLKRIFKL
jgi:acetyltransferase-like isoleucine patch superfamily enzyme